MRDHQFQPPHGANLVIVGQRVLGLNDRQINVPLVAFTNEGQAKAFKRKLELLDVTKARVYFLGS